LRHHLVIGHNCLLMVTNVFGRALMINLIVLNLRSGHPRSLGEHSVSRDLPGLWAEAEIPERV
jgi:hypothetical protein